MPNARRRYTIVEIITEWEALFARLKAERAAVQSRQWHDVKAAQNQSERKAFDIQHQAEWAALDVRQLSEQDALYALLKKESLTQ